MNEVPIEQALEDFQDQNADPLHRLHALVVIVQQFKPNYLEMLQSIFQNPQEHPDVRSSVALAIAKVGGPQAFDILKNYSHDEDITVKNHVIEALAHTLNAEALPLLVEALSDQNNYVFASATDGLSLFGDAAIPSLIALLSSPRDDLRCVGAWKLGELAAPEAIEALLATLQTESNPEVICLCVWALGEIGVYDEVIMDRLHVAQQHDNPDIHRRATWAIRKITRHIN